MAAGIRVRPHCRAHICTQRGCVGSGPEHGHGAGVSVGSRAPLPWIPRPPGHTGNPGRPRRAPGIRGDRYRREGDPGTRRAGGATPVEAGWPPWRATKLRAVRRSASPARHAHGGGPGGSLPARRDPPQATVLADRAAHIVVRYPDVRDTLAATPPIGRSTGRAPGPGQRPCAAACRVGRAPPASVVPASGRTTRLARRRRGT